MSWDVALKMEGRFEGAILTGAISANDRYLEEQEGKLLVVECNGLRNYSQECLCDELA